MLKIIVASLLGIGAAGTFYMFHCNSCPGQKLLHPTSEVSAQKAGETCEDCAPASPVLLMNASTTAPAATPGLVDVKNTKCVVMPDDDAGTTTVSYNGKAYHICCKECVAEFNKTPEKFVKALEADPAKFGLKK